MILAMRRGISARVIHNPKFPIDLFNPKFAEFVGFAFAEGQIHPKWAIILVNKDLKLLEREFRNVEESIGKIDLMLGNKQLRPHLKSSGAYRFVIPSAIGIIFRNLGFKTGKKIRTDPSVPEIYRNVQLDNKKSLGAAFAFLRSLYSGDGCVYISKKSFERKIILSSNSDVTNIAGRMEFKKNKNMFTEYAPQLLKDVKQVFNKLGVTVYGPYIGGLSSIRKYKDKKTLKKTVTINWQIKITNHKNLNYFRKYINFADDKKNAILNTACKKFKQKKIHFSELIYTIGKLQKENGFVTSSLLFRELEQSMVTLRSYLNNLYKANLIKITEQIGRTNYVKYSLTRKGEDRYNKYESYYTCLGECEL